ncbi:kievitone hydratase [Aspergillus violaceofuscus CBS 115571]|uniref:Kievitone hydratase n=1 Tax=Aspergillus violaceofuscus (strain CBS 115571) TaxID=1450538 RepID=A0A2V5H628_ASPV1|nr:kievitone hydratase [Aspergillus violaceofuscus CBS 115571]
MKTYSLSLGLAALSALGNAAYTFRPDPASVIVDSRLPVLYNISEAQTVNSNSSGTGSYWSSSFVTGENGRQYLLLSHTLGIAASGSGYYRASIMDLTSMSGYKSYVATGATSTEQASKFAFEADGYGFAALSADKYSRIRTWSDRDGVTFNVTYEATSQAIFNGAVGQFMYGDGPTHEWALPGCRTTGSLTVGGKEIQIDPSQSVSWYDRQWGEGSPTSGNWTWFELNFDDSTTKASIWMIDNADPYRRDRFATMRLESGEAKFIPVSYTPNYRKTWTSNSTGIEYPLEWTIDLGDEGYLLVKSTVEDQEMAGSSKVETAYEGFVTVAGRLNKGPVTGYGIVEMVTIV